MLFAEISAEGWAMIITAVGVIVGQILSYLKSLDAERATRGNAARIDAVADNQEVAAGKAVEVKIALAHASQAVVRKADEVRDELSQSNRSVERKLDLLADASAERGRLLVENTGMLTENTELTKATLSFVNGPMTAVRREAAELARWKANATGKPEDIRSAEEAEKRLQTAIERQVAGSWSGDSTTDILTVKVPHDDGSPPAAPVRS